MKKDHSSAEMQLILELTKREFRLNYRNSFFGYIWPILNPFLMLLALYVIFTHVMHMNVPNYQFFLLIGIICWNFFSDATSRTLTFLSVNSGLMGKRKISPIVFVISSCMSSAITLLANMIVFIFLAAIFHFPIHMFSLLSLFYLVLLFMLSLGVSLILAVVFSFFRDLDYIWRFSMMIGFWITPIFYSEGILAASVRRIYMLNPMARIISHVRNVLIYEFPVEVLQTFITIIIVLIFFFAGLYLMEKFKKGFGERFC